MAVSRGTWVVRAEHTLGGGRAAVFDCDDVVSVVDADHAAGYQSSQSRRWRRRFQFWWAHYGRKDRQALSQRLHEHRLSA